jgi:predicted amidohydrolase YtcJ
VIRWTDCLLRVGAVLLLGLASCGCDTRFAELAIVNANILTMAEGSPRAEAVAVAGGRFVAVGGSDRVRDLIGEETRVLDLGGKTVVPGFNDAHMHPLAIPPGSVYLGPKAISSMDQLLEALRESARETPAGEWVLGWGYEDTKLGRHPRRDDLDRVSQKHPILILHSSGHVATANSYALGGAGIGRETADPDGGSFDRDVDGEPTGVCRERPAFDQLFTEESPEPQPSLRKAVRSLEERFQVFHSDGITSIGDAWVTPGSFVAYVVALATGTRMRVNLMFGDEHLRFAKFARWLDSLGILDWIGRDRLRVGPIKVFHGNSLSGRTCWLYEPYADRPDYYGVPPARDQQQLDEHVQKIHGSGFQLAVHSNGDREIDMVLEAIEKALTRAPRADHRHRIEHASIVNPGILRRAKEMGVTLALHSYIYEHGDKMGAYGAHRFAWMHANRSALEIGIPVPGSSDFPVSAAHPMTRIQSLVTRTSEQGEEYGPEQRLLPEQAIEVFTLGGARAAFEEDVKGSIEEGKLADLVVLSADPMKVSPGQLRNIQVEVTLIGGEIVFQRSN